MTDRPQLVLDIAGVIVSNFSSRFFRMLDLEFGIAYSDVRDRFMSIRQELWTGRLGEAEFWNWLLIHYPHLKADRAREALIRSLEPLPAAQRLRDWSRVADIHLLSNHCREWLDPHLAVMEPFVRSITISNQVGLCKPDTRIYELVQSHFDGNTRILYVDDQEKNLVPAQKLGWRTLLADREHQWLDRMASLI